MWNYVQGNEGVIVVEDFHPEESFLEVKARVTGPRQRIENVTLKQLGPRRYQGTVPLWGKGRYQVVAVGKAGEREDRATGGLILPYSPEYLRFRSDPITLETITKRTEGKKLDVNASGEEIFGDRKPKTSSRRIFDWFLISLACLLPLDVALRRVQFDPWVVKSWLGFGAKSESTATMGSLLDRKRQVSSQLKGNKTERPKARPQSSPSQPARTYSASKPSSPQPAQEKPKPKVEDSPKDPDNMSTTERLLQMRKKKQDD